MLGGEFFLEPGWKKHWRGMPEFFQANLEPYQTIKVHLASPEDRELFSRLLEREITSRTRAIWYPRETIGRMSDKRFKSEEPLNPRYPVYVPTKGRWETCLTMKALDRIGVPYRAVVEEHQYKKYARVLGKDKILVQPRHDKGLVVTRNWIWDHAAASGVHRFWTMDDNIEGFYRLHQNIKTPVHDGTMLRAMEDFVERYENVPVAGMNYFMFASRKSVVPPYTLNTRVYSNMLILTGAKDPKGKLYRNEGFYNDDTDLCLRMLKDGFCTVLFNAFLIMKSTTMTVKGGMTPHYQGDGRLKMAKELKEKHPDVTTITRKWGRWQHHVDYRRFKRHNKLIAKQDPATLPEVDNFGMYLEVDAVPKPLLIGQAPSASGESGKPLEGRIGRKLAALSGMSFPDWAASCDRVNVFDEFPGKNGKGDSWDPKKAEKRADGLRGLLKGRRVVFLGKRVAKAFGESGSPILEWKRSEKLKAEVATLPHPSGIVLWWNDEDNEAAAASFLHELFGQSFFGKS